MSEPKESVHGTRTEERNQEASDLTGSTGGGLGPRGGTPSLGMWGVLSPSCLLPHWGSDQAHFWEAARSLGFLQELVFVRRQEKGETVIRRVDLGSEFTEGPQELDTISPACPADMKRAVGHTWEPQPQRF